MDRKYELTSEYIVNSRGVKLFRIKALVSFSTIKAGELGGFIEKESNLSHLNDAWVSGKAWVFDNVRVYGVAWVTDNSRVYDRAWVFDNARVCDDALVTDNARVCGNALII